MLKPSRAPGKPHNHPQTFHESLGPSFTVDTPAAFSAAQATAPHLSDRQLKIGLTIIWIMVMILIGAAIGIRLISAQAYQPEPGIPIAKKIVTVAPGPQPGAITAPQPQANPDVTISASQAVNQAQAGSPIQVIALLIYQPADGVDVLLPGYQTRLSLQGEQGIAPSF